MILRIKDVVEKATKILVTMCSTQLPVISIIACFHQNSENAFNSMNFCKNQYLNTSIRSIMNK